MIEFVMVFPIFLLLMFGILEVSLLGAAYLNVDYAAFSAARAALAGLDQAKAKRAAVLTLISQSPSTVSNFAVSNTGFSPLDDFVNGLSDDIVDTLNSLTAGYAGRVGFAWMLTDVQTTSDDEQVTANVTYYYFLKFPVVNRLCRFASRNAGQPGSGDVFTEESRYDEVWSWRGSALDRAPYGFVKIVRSCTLAKRGSA